MSTSKNGNGGTGAMSLVDLIAAAEQGVIAISPAELQRLKSAMTEPVRPVLSAASAGGVRGARRSVPSRIVSGSGEPPRERFEVTVQTAKTTGVPYLGVRLHLVLNDRQLRPAYVSALGIEYILKRADELRSAIDRADKQLTA